MSRGTKYVGVVSQLALALALSGCGAGADASPGGEAGDEVGSVSEALTTQSGTVDQGSRIYFHWVDVTLYLATNDDHTDPTKLGWSAYLEIFNKNPGRLHMRKIDIYLACSQLPWGNGATIQTYFHFSGYVDHGTYFTRNMYCPYGFGYPYIANASIYTESSFGD